MSRQALEKDVELLRAVYGALHPGLHRYNTDAQLDAGYRRILADAGARPTTGSAFVALSRFTAQLRCGHTYVNPYNQSDAVQESMLQGPVLPFLFRWIDGRMVITRSLQAAVDLPPGTVLESLGGVDTRRLLEELMPYGRADGGNDAKRVASLELRGGETYEVFDIHYALLHAPRTMVRLAGRRPDGAPFDAEVSMMAWADRLAATKPPSDAPTGSASWKLEMLDARTAYLRMPSWVMYHDTRDWKADVDAQFTDLVGRKAKTLIIDVRGNEGGDDVGLQIIRHLIGRPLRVDELERRVRYRTVPAELRPPLDTWDPSFFDWGKDAVDAGDGWYRLADDLGSVISELTPLAPRFRGKVIVLVDATNSSATFQFALQMQRSRLGTLVGEPTGGNQRGINGGAFFFVRLRGTGLEVDLPLIARFPHDGKLDAIPDAGVTPDLVVPTTADDIARGRDAVLDAARNRAAKR